MAIGPRGRRGSNNPSAWTAGHARLRTLHAGGHHNLRGPPCLRLSPCLQRCRVLDHRWYGRGVDQRRTGERRSIEPSSTTWASRKKRGPLDLDSERWPWQVRRDAEQLSKTVKRVREIIDGSARGIPVRSLLVYWGRRIKGPAAGLRALGQVQVVSGRESSKWLALISGGSVTADQQDAIVSTLDNHRRRHLQAP